MAAQGTNVLLPSGGTGGLALAAWALQRAGMPTERLARRSVAFYVLTSSVNFVTAAVAGTLAVGVLRRRAAADGRPGRRRAVRHRPRARAAARARPGRARGAAASVLAALSAGIRDAGRLVRSGTR